MKKKLFATMIAATAVAAFAALPAMAEDGDKIVVGVSTDTATTVFRQVELMGLYDSGGRNGIWRLSS
mgnify:CR=1 FL=1